MTATLIHNGTPTSRMAAAAMAVETAATIRERIYQFVLSRGLRGATADEIEEALDISGDTVRPRLKELRGKTPETARLTTMGELRATRSGRQARVWMAREVTRG